MRTPAERLREARQKRGYAGPSEVSERFGWNVNTYKSVENGIRGLSKANAKKWARALRTTAQWLLYEDGPGPGEIQPSDGFDRHALEASIALALDLLPRSEAAEIARAARILYQLFVERRLPDDPVTAETAAQALLDELMRREDI